jgi:hypothetical protein
VNGGRKSSVSGVNKLQSLNSLLGHGKGQLRVASLSMLYITVGYDDSENVDKIVI